MARPGSCSKRIEAGTFERHRVQAQEGIGGEDDEQQERCGKQALHTQRRAGQPRTAALQECHQPGIKRQYQHPQKHRAFMVPPHTPLIL